MVDDLPPHPWPAGAEELYQKSLEATMLSALFMSSPDEYTRRLGLVEWAKGNILGDEAVRLLKPFRFCIITS
jgi:hypothetical protein